ncbi:MAG: glycosyltransferase family 2 protein [Erysipelotrichaceae bacterium]|nr:glycosyltransferase family 2 protein [Erysipelotrichaceae bacterium]
MSDTLYYVIPCYNEEAVLPETAKRLEEKMNDLISRDVIRQDSRVVFVNDGSKDSTWDVIVRLHEGNPLFSGINLSRNRGHQNALLAGMMTVAEYADMIISMDADLQDDIHACDEMIAKYYEGCDIVYGVRSSRKKDTFFKRFTAQSFYRTMDRLGAKTVYNHADYRLMSRRAVQALGEFREVNLFLRGMVPLLGFRTDTVYYERGERFAGESKYPLKKMVSFAVEGITSLSTTPLRMISWSGFFIFLVSLIILVYSLVRHFTGHTVVGWTFLAVSIWGIGGLILLSLGIIGEYVGKIYLETKQRPRYIVEEYLDDAHGYRL